MSVFGRAYGVPSAASLSAAGTLFLLDVGDLNGVGVQVTSPGTSCTISYEFSSEAVPVNWRTAWGFDPGANYPTLSTTTTAAGFLLFNTEGAKWFRARVSTYTSGTVSATAVTSAEAPSRGSITTGGAQTNGAVANPNPVVVAGYDGTSIRSLSVNNQGTLRVIGESQPGASTSTLNVQVGGHDGTNNRVLSTSVAGELILAGNGVAGSAASSSGRGFRMLGYDGTSVRDFLMQTVSDGMSASPIALTTISYNALASTGGFEARVRDTTIALASGVGTTAIAPVPTNLALGVTSGKLISAATTNGTSLKVTAGKLVMGSVSNTTAAFKYLKLYNKASAPTVGTDVPLWTIPIPPNSTIGLGDLLGSYGLFFSTGVAFAITGASADTDATSVAIGDVIFNWQYV